MTSLSFSVMYFWSGMRTSFTKVCGGSRGAQRRAAGPVPRRAHTLPCAGKGQIRLKDWGEVEGQASPSAQGLRGPLEQKVLGHCCERDPPSHPQGLVLAPRPRLVRLHPPSATPTTPARRAPESQSPKPSSLQQEPRNTTLHPGELRAQQALSVSRTSQGARGTAPVPGVQ